MAATSVRLTGAKELQRKLANLQKRVQTKIQKQAVNKGGTIVLQKARERVPVKRGLLRKSLGKKGKAYKRVYVVVIGVRRGYRTGIDGKPVDPAKYLHLVELGTRHSKAQPFLRPALDDNRPQVVATISNAMAEGIEREAKKRA